MMQFYFLLPLPLPSLCFISHVLIRVTNCSFPDVSNTLIAVMYCVGVGVGVGVGEGVGVGVGVGVFCHYNGAPL